MPEEPTLKEFFPSMLYIMKYVKVGQEKCSVKFSEAAFCFVSSIAIIINRVFSKYRVICMSLLALQSCFPSCCGLYQLLRFIFPFSLEVLAKPNP